MTTTTETTRPFVLTVQTQYRENYGAHAWDGEGECPQYWKNKGGDEVIVAHLTEEQAKEMGSIIDGKLLAEAKEVLSNKDDYSETFIIGSQIEPQEEFDARHWEEGSTWREYGDEYPMPKTLQEVKADKEETARHLAELNKAS